MVDPINDSEADYFRENWENMVTVSFSLNDYLNKSDESVNVKWDKLIDNCILYLAVVMGLYILTWVIKKA